MAILSTGLVAAFWHGLLCPSALARAAKGGGEQPQDIRTTDDGFSYQIGRQGDRRQYRFTELPYVHAQGPQVCYTQAKDKPQPEIDSLLSPEDARSSIVTSLKDTVDTGSEKGGSCLPLYWNNKESARRFVSAVNRMIWENSAEVRAQRQQHFEQKVAEWRTAGSKVEVPEEAQRHFVVAQQAFQEKNFQHQAEELSAALDIYPTWPAEQFDLALILSELNRYSEAIQHMRMYLELTPDAPDAQRAKQQIWIWQDKEKADGK